MKLAIIGSRNITNIDLSKYVTDEVELIISGGAKGVDTIAKNYANQNNIELKEIKPDYLQYGRSAPLRRNLDIIKEADKVLAFWDGKSKGTKFVIINCEKYNKECEVIKCQ